MNLNQTNFNKIGIVAKPQALNKVLSEITLFLKQQGRHIVLEQSTATHTQIHEFPTRSLNELQTSVDLIIVIGGDGTMLSVARQMAGSHIPLLGINYGRVGFITDIPLQSAIPAPIRFCKAPMSQNNGVCSRRLYYVMKKSSPVNTL